MKIDCSNLGLYVVLDRGYVEEKKLIDVAVKISEAGCKIIQYRDKISSYRGVLENSYQLKKYLPKETILIVNDYVDIAKEVMLDGVHLGQKDCPVDEARRILGHEKIIGLSTHSYIQAIQGAKKAVDYLGYGPIFKTKTKPDVEPIGTKDLKMVINDVNKPIFAIGGINQNNIKEILKTSVRGIAVVSGILENRNIKEITQKFINLINKYQNEES